MRTLAIPGALRNLHLQNRKLANHRERYSTHPDLIHAVERPASMAWGLVWSQVNRRQGGL